MIQRIAERLRARAASRSRFRSARPRRSARSASCSRWRSSSTRCRRPTSSSTRRRRAARRRGSSPAAACSACRRASSASARTIDGVAAVAGPRDHQRHRRSARSGSDHALTRHRDRGRRPLRRRRLRHSHRRVARSDRARGEDRSDLPRSHLHRESDGRPHRVRPPAEVQENQTVLFWHTGGQVGLFA